MKKIIQIALTVLIGLHANAQKNVLLKIEHKLNGGDFGFNQASVNNLNNSFNITRMEYYLSKIIIKHDGGKTTPATDVYALVNAGSTASTIDLGTYNISNIEGISFSVGVNTPDNNQDPALRPANHPLAPKTPSMHWGWTAGYRFVAMEGKAGNNLLTGYEIHALGNANYFATTVNKAATEVDGKLVLSIFADYALAIKDINVSQNLIVHGETDEAVTLLKNFRDFVFTATAPKVGVETNTAELASIHIWPNPSKGEVNIGNTLQNNLNKIVITDGLGRTISEEINTSTGFKTNIQKSGLYFIQLYTTDNTLIGTRKLIVE
jgi:hypothetical protein